MHQSHSSLVDLLLVEELVLDQICVDEVAHASAGVPSHIVGVHVHFSKVFDHLILVGNVRFGAWGGRSNIRGRILVTIRRGDVDSRVWEGICDLQRASNLHSHNETSRNAGKGLAGVLDNFHDHKGLDLDRLERLLLCCVGHIVEDVGCRAELWRGCDFDIFREPCQALLSECHLTFNSPGPAFQGYSGR